MSQDPSPLSRYALGPQRSETRPGTILTHTPTDPLAPVVTYLRRLMRDRFFGVVGIQLADGAISVIRVEQTIRPAELSGTALPQTRGTSTTTTTTTTTGDAHAENE